MKMLYLHIAYEVNKTKFYNQKDYIFSKNDGVILESLNKIKYTNKKEFYIFHLMGSHTTYYKRYDKTHVLIKNPQNKKDMYDNSIFFTDYILKNIYNKFKKHKKVLFIYFSDHGEYYGHGSYVPFKNELNIPFIIWSNIENKRINKLFKISQKLKYLNMESFYYIFNYITGINNDLNISNSSSIFTTNPSHKLNYDELKLKEW